MAHLRYAVQYLTPHVLQIASRSSENPAFGYDKRLTAVVSASGSLVRGYMAESAKLEATGAPPVLQRHTRTSFRLLDTDFQSTLPGRWHAAGEYLVAWRQPLTTAAWMTTFSVSIVAEAAENDVTPGFAVAGLVADTHKSYVQVCALGHATLRVITLIIQLPCARKRACTTLCVEE